METCDSLLVSQEVPYCIGFSHITTLAVQTTDMYVAQNNVKK